MEDDVRNWLKSFGLQKYGKQLEKHGWERFDEIFHMDEDDLNECITKPGHRKMFHLAVQAVKLKETNNEDLIFDCDENDDDSKAKVVETLLQSIGLGHYISNFENEGWDRLEVINDMDEQEVRNCIDKPGHRKKFQIALKRGIISTFSQTSSELSASVMPDILQEKVDVKHWLEKRGLEQYFDRIVSEGWDTLEVLFKLDENKEDLKQCICKAGHRKRFQLAVSEMSTEVGISPSGKFPEEFADLQMTRNMERKSIAYSQKVFQDTKSYMPRANEEFVASQTEPHTKNIGNVIKISDEEDFVEQKVEGELVRRMSLGQQDTASPIRTKLQEQPVQLGRTFEENEAQPTADLCYDQHHNDVEYSSTGNATSRDSTADDSEETDTCDESEVGTVDSETKSLHRTCSSSIIASTVYIHKAKNMSVGGKIVDSSKRTFTADAKKKYRDNFRKQMQTALDVSKEKDSLFVETKAYRELEEKVSSSHWGVVTGIPGDGKTSMAVHLSHTYNEKGYDHLELHFARDWKDWVDGSSGSDNGKKQFILIDDIFGRMSIDERKVSEWSSIVDLMQKVVQQRQGCLKVVCTSRKYVFEDVKTKLAQFSSFQESSVIDMTQKEFALTKNEKNQIWNNYENVFKLEIPMPRTLLSEDTVENSAPHGFPHCVDLYFRSPSLQKQEDFFDNPMQYICKELDNFKDNDKVKYFALLLVLVKGNELTDVGLEKLTIHDPEFKTLVSAAGLTSRPTSTDLKRALKGLRSTYVTEIDGCYSISHDSIRENLAFVFIKQNPVYAISNMEFEYLTDHTRCTGQKISDNPHSRLMYNLKSQYYEDLMKRMIQEIKRGNVVTVCAHQAWDDKDFVENFMQCLLRISEKTDQDQHGSDRIAEVFNTKDSSTSYIFDFSLFDALRFFGHKEAVKQMLQSKLGTLLDHIPGHVEASKELRFEKPLSLRLHRTMNIIGASPVLRKFQIHSAISMEQLDTVCAFIAGEKFRCYIFGSHSEGTRIITHIPKRNYDVNYLFCLKDSEVVQSLSEVKSEQNIKYLLAVTDTITRPGYVKLQIIHNGVPQTKSTVGDKPPDTVIDHQDRVVLYKRRPDKIHVDENKGLTVTTDIVTGTARQNTGTTQKIVSGTDYEIYHSFRCRSWPKIATKWISRNRHHNWPSRSVIEQIKSLGVFLIPVGSQGSIEKHLEWKILFLLQERMLMSTLNDTQYKCYIILKMINNDIISNRFEEPILVSYHLKTCLFYVIENTQDTLWQPERLLDCVQICLMRILQCANEGNCPNYFIPQENMFYRRVRGKVQTELKNVLIDLLACKVSFGYFLTITCGNLGPRLVQEICGKTDTVQNDQDLVPSPERLYLKLIKFLSLVKMRLLYKCYSTDTEECVRIHFENAVKQLLKAEEVIDHSIEQTERAFSLVLPYVELSLMSVLVARQIEMSKNTDNILPLLISKKWKEIGLSIPVRLKQATFLHMCGQIDASLKVLKSLKQSMRPHMISVCGCQYHHTIVDDATKEIAKDMSEPEFRKSMCVSCVAFLPTEQNVIPDVLGYEMRRAKVPPQSNPTPTFHFWYDWAVVDGKVLLCLMLYLNYRTIRQRNHSTLFAEVSDDIKRKTDDVIKELQNIINEDLNLGHKETGLNILGWIHKQEGDEEEAKRCFRESLEIQSAYNAANELMYISDTEQRIGKKGN